MVRAQVCDIRTDTPQAGDRFFVDTNVWLWMGYVRASLGANQQTLDRISAYSTYLKRCMAAGCTLHYSGLCFSELTHVIEKTEHDIYKARGPNPVLSVKQLRRTSQNHRLKVINQVASAWQVVESVGEFLRVDVDLPMVKAADIHFRNFAVDGYDTFHVELLLQQGISKVLTDDADFVGVSNLDVFTWNSTAIAEAAAAGKTLSPRP